MPRPARFAIALTIGLQALRSQVPTAPLRFEAASVKMTARDAVPDQPRMSLREDSGRIDYQMIGLSDLILKAYNLARYQVVWPKWIADFGRSSNIDRYTIVATMPAGTTASDIRPMLQGLLADRFKLAAHRETEPIPVYTVVVSKSGAKIHKAPDPADDSYMGPMYSSAGWHIAGNYTIARFVNFFAGELDRPLLDATGLEGYYHFDLTWERPMQTGRGPGPSAAGEGPPTSSAPEGGNESSLFSAMDKQLGLGVEKKNLPTEILVIDHVERVPTED